MESSSDVGQTKQETHEKQFTIDDVMWSCASSLTAVVEKLGIPYTVAGILGYPAGEDVFTIYIVMQERATKQTWPVILTIPPAKEETDGRI